MKSHLERLRRKDETLVNIEFLNDKGENYSGANDEDAQQLDLALRDNPFVKQMNFYYHKMTNVGAGYFANIINGSRTLTNLNLALGNITEEGGQALALALENNNTLTYFNLRCNKIGDGAAIFFAKAISSNTCLEQLDLNGTEITDVGATALLTALENNFTLTKIGLAYNKGISSELKKQIKDRLDMNVSFNQSGMNQLIPAGDRQKVAQDMISAIVPVVPVAVAGIIREYDGERSMLERISKRMKLDSESKQTLDDMIKILQDGEVSNSTISDSKPSASPSNATSSSLQKQSEASKSSSSI